MAGRKTASPAGKMEKRSVTLDPELLAWVESQMGPSSRFSNVSHAVNLGLRALKDRK